MKVAVYTTIKKPIGNVVPNTFEVVEAQAVEDKGTYYNVVIHSNYQIRYSKHYWGVQIIGGGING